MSIIYLFLFVLGCYSSKVLSFLVFGVKDIFVPPNFSNKLVYSDFY